MMKRIIPLIVCAILLAGCVQQAVPMQEGAYTFIDDTGTEISVPYTPGKVAALTSSLADLWITAGGQVDITVYETVERGFAPENVILVDDGAGKTVNTELLIASKPDFVLYSSDLAGQAQCARLLRDAGIPAAGFRVETFEDYLRLLKICTDIQKKPEAYEEHGLKLQQSMDALIASAHSQNTKPKVLFVRAGSNAGYTKAKTAENHFACGMLKDLGTENIAEKAPVLLDGLSTEAILLENPDFIFFTTMGNESAGTAYIQCLIADPAWQTLAAVKTGNVHQLPKDLFQYKPNARWAEAYAYLIDILYGEIV